MLFRDQLTLEKMRLNRSFAGTINQLQYQGLPKEEKSGVAWAQFHL
jgi:hypothetical protein